MVNRVNPINSIQVRVSYAPAVSPGGPSTGALGQERFVGANKSVARAGGVPSAQGGASMASKMSHIHTEVKSLTALVEKLVKSAAQTPTSALTTARAPSAPQATPSTPAATSTPATTRTGTTSTSLSLTQPRSAASSTGTTQPSKRAVATLQQKLDRIKQDFIELLKTLTGKANSDLGLAFSKLKQEIRDLDQVLKNLVAAVMTTIAPPSTTADWNGTTVNPAVPASTTEPATEPASTQTDTAPEPTPAPTTPDVAQVPNKRSDVSTSLNPPQTAPSAQKA